jgi:hypothetical protein
MDTYLKGKPQIEQFLVKKMDEERWIAARSDEKTPWQ